MLEMIGEIWRGEIGYQHAKFSCTVDSDCDERVGLPCNDGFCQPGPIIKGFNRGTSAVLTIIPVAIMPQIQVALLTALWFVPMRVRTMAHFLLMTQMALAWSTLDVWLVMLKIRLDDLERYSIAAQAEICEELGARAPRSALRHQY